MTSVTIVFGQKQTQFQYNGDYGEFMRQVQSHYNQLPKDTWKLTYQDEDEDLIQLWNQWDFAEMLREKNNPSQISLILVQDQSQHEQDQVDQQSDNSQQIGEKRQSDVEENMDKQEVQSQENIFKQSNKETAKIRQDGIKQIQSQDKNLKQVDKIKSPPQNHEHFIELEDRSKQNDEIQNGLNNEDIEQIRKIRHAPLFQVENLIEERQSIDDDDERTIFKRKDNGQLSRVQSKENKIKRKSSAQELKQIQLKLTVFTTCLSDNRQIFQFNQQQLFVVLLCHITIKKYRNQKFKQSGGYQQLKTFLESMGMQLSQIKNQRLLGKNAQSKEITNQIHQSRPRTQSLEIPNQINAQSQKTINQIHQQSQQIINQIHVQSHKNTNEIYEPRPNAQSQETINKIHEIKQNKQQPETINQINVQSEKTANKIRPQQQETINDMDQPIPNAQSQETMNQIHAQQKKQTNQIYEPRPYVQSNQAQRQVNQFVEEQSNRQYFLKKESPLPNVNQNEGNKIKQHFSSIKNGQSTFITISQSQCNHIQSGLELLVSQVDKLSKEIYSLQQSLVQLNSIQHSAIQLDTKSNNILHQQKSNNSSQIKLCKSCKARADVVYLQAIYLCHKCQNYLQINCKPRPVNKSKSSNLIPNVNSFQI